MIVQSAIGNLGKDPERKEVNGKTVANFSMACKNIKGETVWIDIDVWGKSADACMQYLSKGKKVYVHGDFTTREHNGKTYLKISAAKIEFLSPVEKVSSAPPLGKMFKDDVPDIDETPF